MDNYILNMQNIKKCIKQKKIYWAKHCLNRLNQRNILFEDVKSAIDNGKIIEYYYEDYPYPSCLVFGHDKNKKALHS